MKQKHLPIDNLLSEYETLVAETGVPGAHPDWDSLKTSLVSEADWSNHAAEHLVALAREHGSFMLRNAYALALALQIEDGSLGF